jgi:hypothetical protein
MWKRVTELASEGRDRKFGRPECKHRHSTGELAMGGGSRVHKFEVGAAPALVGKGPRSSSRANGCPNKSTFPWITLQPYLVLPNTKTHISHERSILFLN